jgi:hypothetical protein
MNPAKRIILCLIVAFACVLQASALTASASVNRSWESINTGYEASGPVSVTYDGCENPGSAYDEAATLKAESESGSGAGIGGELGSGDNY